MARKSLYIALVFIAWVGSTIHVAYGEPQVDLVINESDEQYISSFGAVLLDDQLPSYLDSEREWYSFAILQPSDGQENVLEFLDFKIDDIAIALPQGKEYEVLQTGDHHPFDTRMIAHKNIAFRHEM